MAFFTICPHCHARFRNVPPAAQGTKYTCARCQTPFVVVLQNDGHPEGIVQESPADRVVQPVDPQAQEPPQTMLDHARLAPQNQAPPRTRFDLAAPPAKEVDAPPPTRQMRADVTLQAPETKLDNIPKSPPQTLLDNGAGEGLTTPGPAVPQTRIDVTKPPQKPTSSEVDLWKSGSVILGIYEVIGMLGKGGMGAVYRVRHLGWDLELAVKTPLDTILEVEGGAAAFIREAETWVNLGLHPHIVSCFYVRTINNVPRVFAEYVDGGSLQDYIKNRRFTTIGEILDVAIQLAWGLDFAHSSGLVHQDIKPANILLSVDMVAKITDFGLARAAMKTAISVPGADLGTSGNILVTAAGMTPGYCSPEQQAGEHLSLQSDMWSWAVTMLEAFIGKVMWRSGAVADTALASYGNNPLVDAAIPRMPDEVFELLGECFRKKPEERPPTMGLVADRLIGIYGRVVGQTYPRTRPDAGRNTADSLNNRAVSLLDIGRREEAEALWARARSKAAHHVESTYNTAVYAWKRAAMSDDELLLVMQELCRTVTTSKRNEYLLGKIYLVLNKYDDALSRFDAAMAADPGNAEIQRDRSLALYGQAAYSQNPVQWQVARESLKSVVDLGRTDPHIVTAYAASMQRTGEIEGAERVWAEARQSLLHLPPNLDDALCSYVPRSEIVREWQHFAGPLTAAVISTDGSFVVAIGEGHRLVAWNIRSGKITFDRREPTKKAISMSLSPDDRHLAIACEGENVQLWDLKRGVRIHTLQPHQGAITCLAFSSDGQICVGGSTDRRVRWWNPADRSILHVGEGHAGAVIAVAAGREHIVSGSIDGRVRVWNRTNGHCLHVLTGHGLPVRSVALSGDGRFALSAGDDKSVRLWDVGRGEVIRVFKGHSKSVTAVAFAADGRSALSASGDRSLRLWDLESGQPTIVTRLDASIDALDISMTDDLVLATSSSTVFLLQPFSKEPYRLSYAISMPVSSLEVEERSSAFQRLLEKAREHSRFKRFGEAIETLEKARAQPGFERDDEALALWREAVQRYPRKSLRGGWEISRKDFDRRAVTNLSVSSDGKNILIGLGDGVVSLRDLETGEEIMPFAGHEERISSLGFSTCGHFAFSSGWDGVVILWSLATGDAVRVFKGHTGYVHAAAPSIDLKLVLSVGDDKSLRLFRLESPDVNEILHETDSAIAALAISPDGVFAMCGSWDASLVLLDLEEMEIVAVLEGHKIDVAAVIFSPDGATALSGGADCCLRLWDLRTGRCLRTFEGHTAEVSCVAFSPDGAFAASSSRDGSIRLWDVRHSQCARLFEGHQGSVEAVAFSPDGASLISGGIDGTLRTWYLDWEPDVRDDITWDERAKPYVELFLVHAPLSFRQLELTKTITRIISLPGAKKLTAHDLQRLLRDLNNRGFAWIERKAVETRLTEIVKSWDGTTSVSKALKDAERERLPKAWRVLGKKRRFKPATITTALVSVVVVIAAVAVFFVERVPLNVRAVLDQKAITQSLIAGRYDPRITMDCDVNDRALYLSWVLDPREADIAAVTCFCTVARDQEVTAVVDHLRHIHWKYVDDPFGKLELAQRQFLKIDSAAEERRMTYAEELLRAGQLVTMVAMLTKDEVADSLFSRMSDRDAEVRFAIIAGLAARSDSPSINAVLEAAEHQDQGVREAIAAALPAAIASERVSGRRIFAVVKHLCEDPAPEVRRRAVRALSMFESAKARRLVSRLTSDTDPETAKAAEEVLARISHK